MTVQMNWIRMADGEWYATCDTWPAWSWSGPKMNKKAAVTSLKRHMNKRLGVVHWGWDGRTYP